MAVTPTRTDLLPTLRLLATLFVVGWIVRSFVIGAFATTSVSMLPQLRTGDYLLVAKWPYGWSRYGLVGGAPLFGGRLWSREPRRGDIVVIRDGDRNVVKRVIGLPGDRVAMRHGVVSLDGRALPRIRVGDLLVPDRGGERCLGVRREGGECRYRRFRETLPDGTSYAVLDSAPGPNDDFPSHSVARGTLFLLGDNRDASADSRRSPANGGLGAVPADRLLGRATVLFWSTDGTARLFAPRSWWRTVRWNRIGLSVE